MVSSISTRNVGLLPIKPRRVTFRSRWLGLWQSRDLAIVESAHRGT